MHSRLLLQVVDESSFAFSSPPVPFCSLTDTQQSSFPGPVPWRGGSSALNAPLSVSSRGPPFDAGLSKVASTVLGWLAAGRVWGLWCGTPSLNSVHRRFLVLDGSTSHFTVCQCQSTSPSEVISKASRVDGHFPDESESDLCRQGFPPSS